MDREGNRRRSQSRVHRSPFILFRRVKMWVALDWICSHTGSCCSPFKRWIIKYSALVSTGSVAEASRADRWWSFPLTYLYLCVHRRGWREPKPLESFMHEISVNNRGCWQWPPFNNIIFTFYFYWFPRAASGYKTFQADKILRLTALPSAKSDNCQLRSDAAQTSEGLLDIYSS